MQPIILRVKQEKKHKIMAIGRKKAFDKIQHSAMIF